MQSVMVLSDRDLIWVVAQQPLLVENRPDDWPKHVGPTSIDLHLDSVEEAKVWDLSKLRQFNKEHGLGDEPTLALGTFNYQAISEKYLIKPRKAADGKSTDDL